MAADAGGQRIELRRICIVDNGHLFRRGDDPPNWKQPRGACSRERPMTNRIAHYCVFMFERKDDALVARGPAEYPTAAEAMEAAKAIAHHFAGGVVLCLTKDQDTGELLEAKALLQIGEADFAALVNLFGD
jgi:hypothetical protein